jgi:hypothetical protein
MPIWNDCLARERVFRALFTDWQNVGFPDLGESALDISATPPPASTLALQGPSVGAGGVLYVGGGTKFVISSGPDHFWNVEEISVSGSLSPGGPSLNGPSPLTIGPISGLDGVYTLTYQANGVCIEGPPHGETQKTATFTLDKTPPAVSVTSPTEGQSLDVIDTVIASFSAMDTGVGLDTVSSTLDGAIVLNGSIIDAFYLKAGDHHLIVTATDKLGNAGNVDRKFGVHATIAGLKAAFARGRTEALITIPKSDKSVEQKLDQAQDALNKGKPDQAKNHLGTVANKVAAQSGHGIDAAFAQRYIGWVNDLIARL